MTAKTFVAGPCVTNQSLADWLRQMGVDADSAHRVVIDMKVGDIPRIYIERFPDSRMLNVAPPVMSGAEVTVVDNG